MSLSHQEGPWTGRDRRDGAEKFEAKLGVRLLCAPPHLAPTPFRTIAPILAPEPSVLVRKARSIMMAHSFRGHGGSSTSMIPRGGGPSSYRLPEMTQDTPRITFEAKDSINNLQCADFEDIRDAFETFIRATKFKYRLMKSSC